MKSKRLKKKVQNAINKKVRENSKRDFSENMNMQINALIEVISEYIPDKEKNTNDGTCPDCGSPLKAKWSGVECTECECLYWFCY